MEDENRISDTTSIDTPIRTRVMLVDDHKLFRSGLSTLLKTCCECDVVAEAADGVEFLELLDTACADVVLLDLDMPRMSGREAAQIALQRHPDLKIIVLSMHSQREYYFSMVETGVSGFLLKDCDIDELRVALHTVCSGGTYFSQELLQQLVLATPNATRNDADELSQREREVLPFICRGMSNQEIADKLFISKRTVDRHRANILSKTGCKNTASLVVYAIRNSLFKI